jgi:hypothetical protein
MKYYPIQKNWRKAKDIYSSPEAKAIWYPDMILFEEMKAEDLGVKQWYPTDSPELTPSDFDSCDWRRERLGQGRKGPQPAFWKYVCHGACHYLVDLGLYVATTVEPDRDWRVMCSDDHSTVWDGKDMLWDLNYTALGIDPDEAFKIATKRASHTGVYAFEIPAVPAASVLSSSKTERGSRSAKITPWPWMVSHG